MRHSLSLPANDPLLMRAVHQGRAKGLAEEGMALRYAVLGGNPLPILGGLKPSQHRLCCASHGTPCWAGLVLGFVVSFQTQSWVFSPFQANIGQKEDFEAARKKALALGAKKVTASLPPGARGALSSPCSLPWG